MDERYDSLIASDGGIRRRWPARRVVVMLVAVAMLAAGSIASSVPAAAITPSTCPLRAPMSYQLTIDDVWLQQEVAKVKMCGDFRDTFLVIDNQSSQPLKFWSLTPGVTYVPVDNGASFAVHAKNVLLRNELRASRSDAFVLAGEAVQVTSRVIDFHWQHDVGLTTATVATDVAGALAFNKAKKWASSGSKTKAAVTTCASGAIAAGATAENMDEVMTKLLLGSTACAAAVELAGTDVQEKTLLQRATKLQSNLTKIDSLVEQIRSANVFGRIVQRAL